MRELRDIFDEIELQNQKNSDPKNNPWVGLVYEFVDGEPYISFYRHSTEREAIEEIVDICDSPSENKIYGYVYYNNKIVYQKDCGDEDDYIDIP